MNSAPIQDAQSTTVAGNPRPEVSTEPVAEQQDALRTATCPLCHTSASGSVLEPGGNWRCSRCGQRWSPTRLAAVAAYAASVIERNRAGR